MLVLTRLSTEGRVGLQAISLEQKQRRSCPMARVLLWGHSLLETFLPWVLRLGILPELDTNWCSIQNLFAAWCCFRV